MKIAVVGAGAMGSIYAGLLAEAGNEVWAVDIWEEHLAAIRAHGLRLTGAAGDRVVPVQTATRTSEVGPCDLVVVATKAYDVAVAAASLEPLLAADTPVITIQNGLGSPERLCEVVPRERVLVGVAQGFGAAVRGPGHVAHAGLGVIRLGELDGAMTPRLERLAALWREAGFGARAYQDIEQLVWEKFVCNCTFNGPCTVFGKTIGELMAAPRAWRVGLACCREAFEVGRARGVAFSFDDPERYVSEFGARIPTGPTSTLMDHRERRRSEIDAINGMVPVISRQVGLEAPWNEVVTTVIKGWEADYTAA